MPGVISASEASGAELATTASYGFINAFGLKASDATHVGDLLATGNDSLWNINYMGMRLNIFVHLQNH